MGAAHDRYTRCPSFHRRNVRNDTPTSPVDSVTGDTVAARMNNVVVWPQRHPLVLSRADVIVRQQQAVIAGERANFVGADLSGVNLEGLNLRYANFTGADLRGANLTGASLDYADLSKAKLQEANLNDGSLVAVVAHRASFARATMTNVQATMGNFLGSRFAGTDLTNCHLAYAKLDRTDCDAVNLTGANLSGATATDGVWRFANLTNAHLTNVNLNDTNLTNANLTSANLDGASVHAAHLQGITLTDADMGEQHTAMSSVLHDRWMASRHTHDGATSYVVDDGINGQVHLESTRYDDLPATWQDSYRTISSASLMAVKAYGTTERAAAFLHEQLTNSNDNHGAVPYRELSIADQRPYRGYVALADSVLKNAHRAPAPTS